MKFKSCKLTVLLLFLTIPLIAQERFRKSPPYPDPLPELSLPQIETHLLSNGLDLAVVHVKSPSIISLRLIILDGESSSPEDLPGLATLTARMLNKGTERMSASDIEEAVESLGGSFASYTYPDYSMFTFSFLEEYIDQALELLGEMLLYPTFPRMEISNVQRSMFYDMARQNTDAEFLASRLLSQILFTSHPYGQIIYNQGVIKNLGRRDVVSFFGKYYLPNNAKLILTGNLNIEAATKKVSRYLSPWEKKEKERSFIPPLDPHDKLKICYINLPQAKDATIFLGNIILPISSPDYFPFVVFNQVIGGTPNSRLFMHLRESKGYAYYAFSEVQLFKSCGLFLIKTKVRPEVSIKAIREILNEIENITNKQIPSYEIEQAKAYLIGNFPLNIETVDHLSRKISEIQAFSLGKEHWEKYYENIMRIDSAMVSKIGKKYSLKTPVVVIVCNSDIVEYFNEFDQVSVYSPDGKLQYYITKGEKE
jgi:predicted Zn-dependent peptidase